MGKYGFHFYLLYKYSSRPFSHLWGLGARCELEKRGKFKAFEKLVRVYHGKRGLHLVVLYLVVGRWRIPWSFRVYRGKDKPSPAQLGLRLVQGLPKTLTKHFQVMILVDTAFGSVEFLHGVRKLKYHAIAGVRYDRKLVDGRSVAQLYKRGQQVRLTGLKFPVSISWYYLKRDDGFLEKRFVLSTKPLKGSTITWWGRRRWLLEGWFKTAKHRFGLHRFGEAATCDASLQGGVSPLQHAHLLCHSRSVGGQGTLLGVYRWLVLSLIAYLLAHWAYLTTASQQQPDWGEAARLALSAFLPQLVLFLLLLEIERLLPLARSHGIDIQITRCKI